MSWVKETRKIFPAARIFHKNDVAQFLTKDLLSILECYRKNIHTRFKNFDELLTIIACFRTLSPLKHEASFSNTGVKF